jgi:phosphatidylglycerophosphate synthase
MDKAFVLSVFATLVGTGRLSIVDVVILSAREVGEAVLVVLALVLKPRPAGSERSANTLGKVATVLQFVAVLVVVVGGGPRAFCIYAAGAGGILAAAVYAVREFAAAPKVA